MVQVSIIIRNVTLLLLLLPTKNRKTLGEKFGKCVDAELHIVFELFRDI